MSTRANTAMKAESNSDCYESSKSSKSSKSPSSKSSKSPKSVKSGTKSEKSKKSCVEDTKPEPVTSSPTSSPIASPVTSSPVTSSPVTSSPVTSSPVTSSPVTSSNGALPAPSDCEDNKEWVYDGSETAKSCDIFSSFTGKQKENKCIQFVGTDGTTGEESCPVACNTCSSKCEDSKEWTKGEKACSWFATMDDEVKAKKCKTKSGDDGTTGEESCPVSCNTCP